MAGRGKARICGLVVPVTLLAAWVAPAGAIAPDGKALYNAKCAQCHGRDGTTRPMYVKKGVPDLNDPDWQKERSDEQIRKSIADGSEGTLMKPYKEYWDAAQIDAVVKYVRTLKPPAPAK